MQISLSDLWRWDGKIDRGPYALIGIVAFLIKHNLDRAVSLHFFHQRWGLISYFFPPAHSAGVFSLVGSDRDFFLTMVALSLPFIWMGIVLTLRRLRSLGLRETLVLLFFFPVVNLIFFTLLCILPAKNDSESNEESGASESSSNFWDRLIPQGQLASGAMALLVTAPFGALAAYAGSSLLQNYGWGIFIALPFCQGLGATLIYSYHSPKHIYSCMIVALLSVFLLATILIFFAVEGMICLLMASPIVLALGAFGALIGYIIQRDYWQRAHMWPTFLVLILISPSLMGAERVLNPLPPFCSITSQVEVEASAERVWKGVISFREIPPPKEWLFQMGAAYPVSAELDGTGPGAIRRCVFSTGAFVEPIEVWDEPRLLKFSVSTIPPPMREWTFYREIHPAHLKDHLMVSGGQFLLTSISENRTLLEGTTWYSNRMWPASYWRLWTDYFIHRIHLRVLDHIKREVEENAHRK